MTKITIFNQISMFDQIFIFDEISIFDQISIFSQIDAIFQLKTHPPSPPLEFELRAIFMTDTVVRN